MKFHAIIALLINVSPLYAAEYNVKVLDYTPYKEATPEETILKNLNAYSNRVAATNDLVVFPEYGLTTIEILGSNHKDYAIKIPDPSENIIPCITKVNTVLNEISCLASQKQTYLVINLLEEDGKDNSKIYNTNVVFDRKGQLIAKYRKINLFGDENKYLKPGSDLVTFKTDFGVTFGTFTCYDILFKRPALDILDGPVTDIAFPTAWGSQLPFLSALSVQYGYSKKNGVNLYASNYNKPANAYGGSGVYPATGVPSLILQYAEGDNVTEATITALDKRPFTLTCNPLQSNVESRAFIPILPTINNFHYKNSITESPSSHTYKFLQVGQKQFKETICSNDGKLCCDFKANVLNNITETDPRYAFITYSRDNMEFGCALVSCENGNFNSCGTRLDSSSKFSFVDASIKTANLTSSYNIPVTLTNALTPFDNFKYCSNSEYISIEMGRQSKLTTLGFYIASDAITTMSNIFVVSILSISIIKLF